MSLTAFITSQVRSPHTRGTSPLAALLMATALGGCQAHAQEVPPAEDLNRTMTLLRTQNAAYARQIEELENRVFILADRVEGQKVREQRKADPVLPVEVLTPAVTTGRVAVSMPRDLPSDSNVEFSGEAAKIGSPRPLLHLTGEELPVFPAQVRASGPRPTSVQTSMQTSMPTSMPTSMQKSAGLRQVVSPSPVAVLGEKSAGVARTAAGSAGGPVDLYRQALDQLWGGRPDDASAAFRGFVRQWPRHDLADNAQYWLGECYYAQKQYVDAVAEFRRVSQQYPHGNKVPDALLKLGFSYLALGSAQAGRQSLQTLMQAYPQHSAAALAKARLAELAAPAAIRSHEGRLP